VIAGVRWAPAALLCAGALGVGVNPQRVLPLRRELATTVPARVAGGFVSRDLQVPVDEQQVAGMTSYLLRVYSRPAAPAGSAKDVSLYVGYYSSQTEGRTIHSPKNCLPGAGWDVLGSRQAQVATAAGTITVNRYLLQKKNERALVLYWYQGRGRIEASEYAVKWQLLRDTALRRRSDEALVRVIVPVVGSERDAFRLASEFAAEVVPSVSAALPAA